MMMAKPIEQLERLGRGTVEAVSEIGFGAVLLVQSLVWTVVGKARRQPVRLSAVVREAMEIGIRAIPIVSVMSGTIAIMLAIQGIYSLRTFGAEQQVTYGVAVSIVREFAPLITGILVAGRSGSALAARIGTMKINQEIDALIVMGINPVRFLVAPSLLAAVVMLPAITFMADLVGLLAAGLYIAVELEMSLAAYWAQVIDLVRPIDLFHGLIKSVLFAILIVLVGIINGAGVTGGAEGVGRLTTRSVVHAISAIIITDMLFVFMTTR